MTNQNVTPRRWFSITVPMLLVLLSLAVIAPFAAFSLYSLARFSEGLTKLEIGALEGMARSTSANVDREIRSLIAFANALASSPSLPLGDLKAFHAEAKQAIRSSETNVILLDPTLQQLVNTRVAFGTALPKTSEPEVSLQAMRTKVPAVSDVFIGKVAKRLVFNVAVPVIYAGETRYILVATAEPGLVSAVLEQQMLPKFWNAAVRDGSGQIFATSKQNTDPHGLQFPGPAHPGALTNHVLNGEPSFAALWTSELTGWTTAVWVPDDILKKPTNDLWSMLLQAGLFATALSVLISYAFSRPFANLIRQTAESTTFVGHDDPLPPIRSILKEGHRIEVSLRKANLDLQESQRKNREAKALLDTLMDNVPEGLTVLEYPSCNVIAESKKAREWLGTSSGDLFNQLVDKKPASTVFLADGITPLSLDQATLIRATSENRAITGENFVILQPNGLPIKVEVSASPFHDAAGKVIGGVATWRDVTQQVETMEALEENQQRLQVVLRELTHRAKNLLAVIMSIATQTARKNTTLDEFLHIFAKRIQGLGTSHDLLVKSDWRGVLLGDLLSAQLSPFGGIDDKRIKAAGSDILLKPDVLQSLGLAFHELATNASKYGALSNSKGSIQVKWETDLSGPDPVFRISWVEKNGPPVEQPTHKGFGHVIMGRLLAATVNGEVDLKFGTKGVVWTMTAPLRSVIAADP